LFLAQLEVLAFVVVPMLTLVVSLACVVLAVSFGVVVVAFDMTGVASVEWTVVLRVACSYL